MFREDNIIGIKPTVYHTYCDLTIKRHKRSRKNIEHDIFNKDNQIRITLYCLQHPDARSKHDTEDSLTKRLQKQQHEMEKLQTELHAKDHGNIRHKNIKTRYKKWDLTKLEQKITDIIADMKTKKIDHVTKEDMAHHLNARVSQVEHVFMHLNQKGILTQPVHHAMHDSQREPWGFTGSSDWCSDLYYIN